MYNSFVHNLVTMTQMHEGLRTFITLNSVQVCTCQYKMFSGIIFMGHSVCRLTGHKDETIRLRAIKSVTDEHWSPPIHLP